METIPCELDIFALSCNNFPLITQTNEKKTELRTLFPSQNIHTHLLRSCGHCKCRMTYGSWQPNRFTFEKSQPLGHIPWLGYAIRLFCPLGTLYFFCYSAEKHSANVPRFSVLLSVVLWILPSRM